MQVGVRSGSESFSQTEKWPLDYCFSTRSLMAKGIHPIPENSQGSGTCRGSKFFWVTCSRMTEQCSFIEFGARQGSLGSSSTSLITALFIITPRGYGRKKLKFSVWARSQQNRRQTMGSKNGVVIGSVLPEVGRVPYFANKKGALGPLSLRVRTVLPGVSPDPKVERVQELGAGAELVFFLSKSNAGTISLSSATSGETAWVKSSVLTLAIMPLARV
ncbi:hypothetical protein Tco_1104270 [Tanacetum coccineum]